MTSYKLFCNEFNHSERWIIKFLEEFRILLISL